MFIQPSLSTLYGRFNSLYRKGFLNPPLNFAYLAANLVNKGHQALIIDMDAERLTYKQVLSLIQDHNPHLIGLSITSPTLALNLELALLIKASFPRVPIVTGGIHLSIFQKDVLRAYSVFDFGIIGDGENALAELIENLQDRTNYGGIEGLIWRSQGEVIQNEYRPPDKNLDHYPFPARHLLKNDLYVRNIPYKGYQTTTAFMSSRGCPFDCIYCAVKNIPNGTMVRLRSPENVVAELDWVVNRLGIKHIAFNDDCLTFNRKRIFKICDEIFSRNLRFTWEGLSRADLVDLELLETMKKAGFSRISFGIESGNQKILDVLNKKETLETIAHAIRLAHQAGIITRGSVIFGSPYETTKEVKESIRFFCSLKELDQVIIGIMQPYPGTKVREMVLQGEGGTRLIKSDFADLRRLGNASMEVNDLSCAVLESLQRRGMRSFYLRPRTIMRNLVINHPFAFVQQAIGAVRSFF